MNLDDLPPKHRANAERQLREQRRPHIVTSEMDVNVSAAKKRVRQSRRGLNKLETEFYERLQVNYDRENIYVQSFTLLLGNGVRYTPDFVCAQSHIGQAPLTAYEVKGAHAWEDSLIKLKLAPQKFGHVIRFVLAWKDFSSWFEQTILA